MRLKERCRPVRTNIVFFNVGNVEEIIFARNASLRAEFASIAKNPVIGSQIAHFQMSHHKEDRAVVVAAKMSTDLIVLARSKV